MKLKVRKEDYLPHQFEFLTSTSDIVGLIAGLGAGKTHAFLRKTFLNHLFRTTQKTEMSKGLIVYPTYDLADELFVDEFSLLLERHNIQQHYNQSKHRFYTAYGEIKVFQLQKPKRIVGTEQTYIGFDEFDIESYNNCDIAFKKAIGRMRGSDDIEVYFVSTPEGLHYLYKIFVTDNADGKRHLIHAKTTDNPHLPSGYIDRLYDVYPPKLVLAYINGQFVSMMEGNLYYNFDRDMHVDKDDEKYKPDDVLYLTCDFNKAPMCWEVAQLGSTIRGTSVHYVDEIHIKAAAQTRTAAELFCRRFEGHSKKELVVCGDASGNITTTRDYTTDYLLIAEVLKENKWIVKFDIPASNPNVANRVNMTTSLIHQGRLSVSSRCTELMKDYENVTGDGKGAKDKDNKDLTHASDASDYLIYKLFWREFLGMKVSQK